MATSPNLPLGGFITTLEGRRCTAVPRTDISTQASTTSTFSTSLTPPTTATPITTTSAAQVAPAPAIQNSVEQTTTPTPVAATTSSASIGQFSTIASSSSESSSSSSSESSSTPQPSLSVAVASPPQASETDTTPAALSTTPLTTASSTTATSTQAAESEVLGGSGNTTPFTTIGLASSTAKATSQATNGVGITSGSAGTGKSGSNGNGSTIAVAGGIIGGVALVSLIAFLLWFWRRRLLKRRRSTALLTPLSADPSFGADVRSEKGHYLFQRGSIGPTPRSTKVKAALRAQYGRVRGRFDTIARSASVRSNSSHATSRSVDMNRGNSQFMDSAPVIGGHSRDNSSALSAQDDGDMTIKERVMEMWARFKGSGKRNFSDDNEKNDIFAARGIAGGAKKRSSLNNRPDFLTLLNMDDNELDRVAQRRRLSRTRGGSEGSNLGGLSLDFGENPFSDVNALTSTKSRVGPPVASSADNPFSDANAVVDPILPRKPATYISDIRRSRGQSVGSAIDINKSYGLRGLRVVNEEPGPATGALRGPSIYRDSQASAASFESFATKRDKFRSDPFDLEQLSSQVSGSIPNYTSRAMFEDSNNLPPAKSGPHISSSESISVQYQMSTGPLGPSTLARPAAAHTRHLSDSSSKYTSGISEGTLDDWSDPGPDVGPATTRYDPSRRSSGAAGANVFGPGTSSSKGGSSRRSSGAGSVRMGYAL